MINQLPSQPCYIYIYYIEMKLHWNRGGLLLYYQSQAWYIEMKVHCNRGGLSTILYRHVILSIYKVLLSLPSTTQLRSWQEVTMLLLWHNMELIVTTYYYRCISTFYHSQGKFGVSNLLSTPKLLITPNCTEQLEWCLVYGKLQL